MPCTDVTDAFFVSAQEVLLRASVVQKMFGGESI